MIVGVTGMLLSIYIITEKNAGGDPLATGSGILVQCSKATNKLVA